jgi:hypothetical protein
MAEITHVDVRMYGTGTGDTFVLKFYSASTEQFTMMIDGGTWKGKKAHLEKYVKDLKKYVNNKVDLLVITHEHKDHVYLFDACENLFTNDFEVRQIWMAWSENEDDEQVKKWKEQYGQKKKALVSASEKVGKFFHGNELAEQFSESFNVNEVLGSYRGFADSLSDFRDLHVSLDSDGQYKGGLKGMEVIKKKIANGNIRFFEPGDIEQIMDLPGVKFHILGPPRSIKAIKKEHGKKGSDDTYDHNKVLRRSDSFSAAVSGEDSIMGASPFAEHHASDRKRDRKGYESDENAWRRIDHDWLMSAGHLALRLNSGINNLSLAMAIEFEDSKRVMLFPGDAEFGSWESWHEIDWEQKGEGGKHLTEDLLNRTVFYKVAHHLSHNGTAKEKGLEMMKSEDLVSMATLDFNVISHNWKGTMPNRGILKDLIEKTRGRLIVMNEEGLYYDFDGKVPLKERIEKERKKLSAKQQEEFEKGYKKTRLYKQYRVSAT